jgi:flagellar hook-associated protein 1 FlgK
MSLFGYYSLGLQAMSVARLGLQVAGDNIANVFTPGYARRTMELTPGYPISVQGGFLDMGVDVARLRRMEDRFLQASLEREQGKQAGSDELLRGLGQLETVFGALDGAGNIAAALAEFSAAFSELAAQPESSAHRRGAVSAADALARSIRDAYERLQQQRSVENRSVAASVDRVNALAEELATVNKEIHAAEAGGGVATSLRDQRTVVIEELSQLTGGSAYTDGDGRLSFAFAGGPTLVTGQDALLLTTSRDADGMFRIHSGADGADITDRMRDGRLGSQLSLRDEAIPDRTTALDDLAVDLTTRANALTTAAFDLQGNPGVALFRPDPATGPGAARLFALNPVLRDDPDQLAVSSTGSPGEGDIAALLADLPGQASAALNDKSPEAFFADLLSGLGNEVAQADVAEAVSRSLVESMLAQRDTVSGVSLDEEAVQLVQFQQSYEAAARFIEVLNQVTETAVNLAGR